MRRPHLGGSAPAPSQDKISGGCGAWGLEKVLVPLVPSHFRRFDSDNGWAQRDPEFVDDVNSQIERAGLDQEAITPLTLEVKLDKLVRIPLLIAGSESRLIEALQEIFRYLDALRRRLHELSQ